jgi:hypothetical protein
MGYVNWSLRLKLGIALAVVGWGILPAQSYAGLYLVDAGTDSLHSVNQLTGQLTTIGPLGFDASASGLAENPFGGLFLIDGQTLYQVDTNSGRAAMIGGTNLNSPIYGLAYHDALNALYGASLDGSLYRLDVSNGSANLVGALGINLGGIGMAYDSIAGQLLLVDSTSDKLYHVNALTGAANEIGNLNVSDVVGLAFNPETNTLFGADYITDELVVINQSTGAGVVIGRFGIDVGPLGLAFQSTAIPEPSSLALLAGMWTAAAFRRRR